MELSIYKSEREIASKIRDNRSLAYLVPLTPGDVGIGHELVIASANKRRGNAPFEGAEAALTDFDLYPVKSVLVSTVWNGNDDFFLKEPTWAARNTPKHKPDNLNHSELDIVGHMVDCWAVTEAGEIIPDDSVIDDIPDLFHLVNSSVVYTHWKDEARAKEIDELITAIKKGEKFVSMECFFRGFNYALRDSSGSIRFVPRNETTAFLSKHLLAYGGKGEYNGERLGRVLQHITFRAKGYVDTPANPDSIIFAKKHTFSSTASAVSEVTGVLSDRPQIKDTINMADNEKTLDEIKGQLANLVKANKEHGDAIKKLEADKAALETKVAEAVKAKDEAVAALDAKVKGLEAEKTALTDAVATAQQAVTDTKAELDTAIKAKNDAETKVAEAAKVAVKAARITKLTSAGMKADKATELVDRFTALGDPEFDSLAEVIIAAIPAPVTKASGPNEDEEDDEEDGDDGFDVEEDDAEASVGNVAGGSDKTETSEAKAVKELRGLLKAHASRKIRKGDK